MKNKLRQSGNIFFALFGAVAMVGVLGAAVSTILKGPVAGMQRVTKYTVAENNMIAAGKLALIAATNQPLSGDCDADDMVEPIPYSTTGDGPFPVGGGYLPAEIGATRQDPWGNIYGYCVWDHGIDPDDPTDNDGECGGSTNFRKGANSEQYIALAVISSGPDRVFQSSCRDFDPDNPEIPLVVKSAGSDDVVLAYTYAEAGSMSGGLWKLKSGDSSTAEVGNRNVEIAGSGGAGDTARIGYDEGLDMSGVGEFLAVKTDHLFARTADGNISVESPLRVQTVTSMEKPMGVAGEGIGTKSVIAPAFRKQMSGMPIAPDGQDWADAIVCPDADGNPYTFILVAYGGVAGAHYLYENTPSARYLVAYNHIGSRSAVDGDSSVHGNFCPSTYAAAIKVYFGGGGTNTPSILPGWPDAIKCPRTGNSGENIYYLMHAGAGVQDQVWYSLAGSSNNNWNVIFKKSTRTYEAADGVNMGTLVSNASRHCLNASTTIDMLVEDGRGVFFGGGSDASAGGPPIPSFSCPGGFEKVGALGCIQSAETAATTWPAASNACFTNYGGRLPTSAEWYAAAANSSTMAGKTGNWEWVADLVGEISPYDNHGVVGSTAITDFSWASDTGSYAYRCFIPASGGGGLGGGGGDFQIASGKFVFAASNPPLCGSSTSNLCTVDISSGGFSTAPSCNITLYNSDGTSYTENVVIQSTSPTELKFWRGQYLNNGTSFIGDWICAVGSGSGGGSGGGNFLPGWPDVISCEFAGAPYDGEEVFFYPAGINNGGQYAYFTQVSTGGERFRLVYAADKSFVSFVELPGNTPRTGSCHNKSIPELYAAGHAFDFGGGGGGTGGGSGVGSTITASIPANQDISGACIYPGTGTLTIPEAGHYFIRGHASGYKYSGNAVDITLFLEKSGGGHVFAASGGIPSTSNSYFYADVSDILFLEGGLTP